MDSYDKELEQKVPDFEEKQDTHSKEISNLNISSAAYSTQIRGWKQTVGIIAVAIFVIGLWELLVRVLNVPDFILPPPSKIIVALVTSFPNIYQHLLFTLAELVSGYLIGAAVGLIMAAVLTQMPFIEKIITPYILILVTTPTIALVPLLMLYWGFGIGPRIFAVALATGPMVMINATTGFRRTDLAKIALAKSYGASTFQIFYKIRFPLALPMINVGLLVGGIFGLITAVGSDMVGGKIGLGNRISYYASLARMSNFFAIILLVALIGISIWIIMTIVGNKTTNWSE
ncbi:MAG: ABC transporter permease [Actinobacteria bacterium]|nr:ABC transporter permease [Cyanobacteriota bacterium]MCL5771625.1 ABC transporter permease [Actinomycetota bacterium]